MSPEWAELDALSEGLRFARSLNLDTYCKHREDIKVFGFRIKESRKLIELFTKAGSIGWIVTVIELLISYVIGRF
ncbi:hypothetical protein PVK06_021666 [Gossypium arboreum]|uniref:Uncharacterized protein n=1 Tax=Gossypium arboreum TaxID=29729 RepID=A0ABR0PQW7_GOSAR|nr:hypothetical protein PVK06_021666 [Gossypium arboreum]